MAKIGIYSGTFDPVHTGHIAFAETAIAELKIDTLYMLAEETPWRKTNVTPVKNRQAMLDLAVADSRVIKTSLKGMSDQHDVVSSMKAFTGAHPKDSVVLLMGADVFLNIDKWKDYKKLIQEVEFAVALRTEDDGEELIYKLQEIPEAKVTKIVTDQATVASSKIREAVAQDADNIKDINAEVLQYIRDNQLYL